MKLVIAEKPMLARDIARAICGRTVSETARLPISGNGYTVCACAGHLLELIPPEQIDPRWGSPWTLEALPIHVADWPKAPVKDKEGLVEEIRALLEEADGVIHAGDPDDEGQLIVDELLDYLAYNGPVERVYVNDNIEKNIRKAFAQLVPNEQSRGAGAAAYARQMADLCFGVNESRLATLRLGSLFTVGRVQTPTLGLVVSRDEQIEGHVKQKFYELTALVQCQDALEPLAFKFKPAQSVLAGEKHLLSPDVPQKLKAALAGTAVAFETETSEKRVCPPLDYQVRSKAFNDANVSAHHGIIPQEAAVDTAAMTQDERKVYAAIVERYAMQFLPPAVYDVSTSAFDAPEGRFECVQKALREAGWKGVFAGAVEADEEDGAAHLLGAGSHEAHIAQCEIAEKETAPPKPYTEGTLITDMASIARYVADPEIREILKAKDDGKKGEHGGIGTTATRAEVIEKLKSRGFIEENKGKLRSTKKGRAFYHLLPEDIRGADTTARWWLLQQDVEAAGADANAIWQSVVETFLKHKDAAYSGASIPGGEGAVAGACPLCGKDVVKRGKIFSCSPNPTEKQADGTWAQAGGCGFKLLPWCGKKFTAKQAEALLAGKLVSLKGCKSRAGKTFDCKVRLDGDGEIQPVWDKKRR